MLRLLTRQKSDSTSSQAGLSLVEMVMAAGAVGGVMMAVMAMLEVQNRGMQGNRLIASRDSLKNRLDRYISSPAVIAKSARHRDGGIDDEANRILEYCVNGAAAKGPPPSACAATAPAGCCVATPTGSWQTFNLLDPAPSSGPVIIAGTQVNPARYQPDGNLCHRIEPAAGPSPTPASQDASCVMEVVTQYSAQCAGGATSCDKASAVQLNYEIRQAAGKALKGAAPLKTQNYSQTGFATELNDIATALAKIDNPTGAGGSGGGSTTEDVASNFKRRIFTADSAFEVPAGVNSVYVTLIGGGGGGGGGSGGVTSGGFYIYGGAGGASSCVRLKNLVAVKPGSSIPIKVGKGGRGGTGSPSGSYNNPEAGSPGGASSFGSVLTLPGAAGGSNGGLCCTGCACHQFFKGGSGTCPSLAATDYFKGTIFSAQLLNGNNGGDAYHGSFGPGAAATIPNIDGPNTFGAGGSGGGLGYGTSPGKTGESGKDGAVIVEYLEAE